MKTKDCTIFIRNAENFHPRLYFSHSSYPRPDFLSTALVIMKWNSYLRKRSPEKSESKESLNFCGAVRCFIGRKEGKEQQIERNAKFNGTIRLSSPTYIWLSLGVEESRLPSTCTSAYPKNVLTATINYQLLRAETPLDSSTIF